MGLGVGASATAIGSSATATAVAGVVAGTAAEVAGVSVGATAVSAAAGTAGFWTGIGTLCLANPFTSGFVVIGGLLLIAGTGGAAGKAVGYDRP